MNNQLTVKKVNSLLSNSNKQAFIILLGSHLEKKGMRVIHAEDDADLLIVKTALQMAKQDSTVLIGEDTDLLILALFHFKDEKEQFFTCEPKEKNTKSDVWSIGRAKQALGDLCDGLLFVHALTGCDTTSRIHSVGKGAVLRKYKKIKRFRELAQCFMDETSSKEDVIEAGEQIMLLVNGETKRETTMTSTAYRKLLQ